MIKNQGVFFDEKGKVRVSLVAKNASKVSLVLFEDKNNLDKETKIISLINYHDYWQNGESLDKMVEGTRYGFLVHNSQYPEWQKKLILDPFSLAIDQSCYQRKKNLDYLDNLSYSLRSVLVKRPTSINQPLTDLKTSNLKIAEIHVKSFTQLDKNLDFSQRGKILGIIEKLDFLQSLGFNAIELMPIMFFDEQESFVNKEGKFIRNYWGYQPISFFALFSDYFSHSDYQTQFQELTQLVKACHQRKMAVILDVVYNHTGEGNQFGPTFSYKVLSDSDYYLKSGFCYHDHTGCGHTFNANNSLASDLIIQSLEYFRSIFGIDGFRFDLAGSFFYDHNNNLTDKPLILEKINHSSILKSSLMIGEPWSWDLNCENRFLNFGWLEWAGQYRDVLRRIIRGEQVKNYHLDDLLTQNQSKVKYFACHDGMTVKDLVSFDQKNNWSNGENNFDGTNFNHSSNYGVEGVTSDVNINKIRQKQIRNFFILLNLSFGPIMIQVDDILQHSKNGNNNSFCQDNDISYLKWLSIKKIAKKSQTLKTNLLWEFQDKEEQKFFKFCQNLDLKRNNLTRDSNEQNLTSFVFYQKCCTSQSDFNNWLLKTKAEYILLVNFSSQVQNIDLSFFEFEILIDSDGGYLSNFIGKKTIDNKVNFKLSTYSACLLQKKTVKN